MAAGSALADVELFSSHMPAKSGAHTQFAAECIDAVREHWPSQAGLVLKRRAQLGKAADGTRLLNVNGHVWRDGERVAVSHQCANQSGSPQLALHVQVEQEVAERD